MMYAEEQTPALFSVQRHWQLHRQGMRGLAATLLIRSPARSDLTGAMAALIRQGVAMFVWWSFDAMQTPNFDGWRNLLCRRFANKSSCDSPARDSAAFPASMKIAGLPTSPAPPPLPRPMIVDRVGGWVHWRCGGREPHKTRTTRPDVDCKITARQRKRSDFS